MIATVNGTTLSYQEVGQGPACLMLNGGMGTDQTLLRTLDPLGDRLRLIQVDQRGTGRSGRPPLSTLTMAQLADDAAALAGHLGVERTLVLGHSFGGFVAQELALRHPELVAGLVLVATTAGRLGTSDRPDDEQGPPPPAEVTAIVRAMVSGPATDDTFAAMTSSLLPYYLHRHDPAALTARLQHAVYDVATFRATAALLNTWSAIDRLDRIAAPTLLLVGRQDPVCAPAQSHRIARRIPGAQVIELAESGHFPWLDEPARFYRVLHDWLDRHARPTTTAHPG
ncbi:MAG TPA: alpha/beta hydrolase [Mycobacteriales bacterium]|nr:alpha/beta hydrolase [Mycobacteriales bacterium]